MSRITLDYTPAINQRAGIGRLTRELVAALLQLPATHPYKLFVMGRSKTDWQSALATHAAPFAVQHSLLSDRWLHRIWFKANLPLPVQWLAGECDLYHATDFVLPPLLPSVPSVLTVHDLSFERDPASAMPTLLAFLRKVVPRSAKNATHLISDSVATAKDLTDLYDIAPEKITTIYSGASERFKPTENAQPITNEAGFVRTKYKIGNAPFVLAVGTLQPRKNHLGLVRAFAHPSLAHQNISLVIAGGKGWLYDTVMDEVRKLGLGERVKFIGFADDADLPALYRSARVFAFPSFYEGFGLPLLEAMACGVPVIASNTSSLPEVVGDAGLMIDPHDTDALAIAIQQALFDEHWRDQAIANGIARAKTFTWQRAAQQLLAVYAHTLKTKIQ